MEAVSSERANRVREAIKEELSDMIRLEVKDPRIGFASITSVEVAPDLRYARVFVSVFGDDAAAKRTLEGLASSRGFLRTELGKRLRLRFAPELAFELDHSLAHGDRIARLLAQVGMGSATPPKAPDGPPKGGEETHESR